MRAYLQPLWTGELLCSRRLLLWGEQGVGDEIMFAGLLPEAIRAGNRITLDCDPRLEPLLARSFPEIEVISTAQPNPGLEPNPALGSIQRSNLGALSFRHLSGEMAGSPPASQPQPASIASLEPDFAAHLPTGSLPGLFRATVHAFGASTSPYLKPDPVERARFRARYSDGRRLVGLAWQTKNQKTGCKRSIDLHTLAPLFALQGIRWISLQYGDFDALEQQAALAHAPILIDRNVDQFASVDLFASQVAAMDHVLTIDNSTAHLAGALGIPVWLMIPFAADWRWLKDRQDSPWYPSMRLFRQPGPGDWRSVLESVHAALASALK
jgi:ADP-heptose:LPS heptosyltransferase